MNRHLVLHSNYDSRCSVCLSGQLYPHFSFQTTISLISNWFCKQIIAFAPDRAYAPPAVIFKFPNRNRLISTSRLSTLRCVHLKPINVIISHVSQTIPNLGVGFPLRCFQRLSIPNIATLRCPWQDSRYTRGSFTSVLSSLSSDHMMIEIIPLSLGAQTISSSSACMADRMLAYYIYVSVPSFSRENFPKTHTSVFCVSRHKTTSRYGVKPKI